MAAKGSGSAKSDAEVTVKRRRLKRDEASPPDREQAPKSQEVDAGDRAPEVDFGGDLPVSRPANVEPASSDSNGSRQFAERESDESVSSQPEAVRPERASRSEGRAEPKESRPRQRRDAGRTAVARAAESRAAETRVIETRAADRTTEVRTAEVGATDIRPIDSRAVDSRVSETRVSETRASRPEPEENFRNEAGRADRHADDSDFEYAGDYVADADDSAEHDRGRNHPVGENSEGDDHGGDDQGGDDQGGDDHGADDDGGDDRGGSDGAPSATGGSDSDDDSFKKRRRRRRRRSRGGNPPTGGAPQQGSHQQGSHQQGGQPQGSHQQGGHQSRDQQPRDHQQRDYQQRDNQQGGQQQNGRMQSRQRRGKAPSPNGKEISPVTGMVEGVLELHPKGYGFLRDPANNYASLKTDTFVSGTLLEKFRLREGVIIRGEVAAGTKGQGPRLRSIESVDGRTLDEYQKIKPFDELTAINPFEQIKLETGPTPITMRVMDLLTPIGKGQRALIVAPPRTGKTMLLQEIANAVSANHPELHLMVLLIDERPEEVTEMRRRVRGEVIASSMDRDVESHVRIAQLIVERGKRIAEAGGEVFILLDSITRTARAFNKWVGNSGRTISGGLDVKALDIPKKLFGTARRFDEGGSLTVVATALIETGSRMDDVIFQEFKGTGNMEMVLNRQLADRRIWPSIDVQQSGTRREEKILPAQTLEGVTLLRRSLASLNPIEAMEQLIKTLGRFQSNAEFLAKIRSIM